jgi:hypothetical protein
MRQRIDDGRGAPRPGQSSVVQRSEASNSTIWLPTGLVVAEFSCSAPQRDGKLPSTVRESGECRLGARDATYERRLLRVGIPFGESLADRYADNAADLARGNRGLLFLAIQASIEGKFKFLQARWANDPSRPKMPGGNDMIGRMLPCATG